jgi:hypothetical protein
MYVCHSSLCPASPLPLLLPSRWSPKQTYIYIHIIYI